MLAKYASPLPEGWKEKYDPGTGRHFYWCTRTDRVSWLPPGHPKAKVGNIELNNSIHLEAFSCLPNLRHIPVLFFVKYIR